MWTSVNKMKKILIILVLFKVANASFLGDSLFRRPTIKILDNPFWKDFEQSMKELETSLRTQNEESEEDTGHDDLEEPEMIINNAWWRGSNVCVTKEIRELPYDDLVFMFGNFESRTTVCKESNSRYACTTNHQSKRKHTQTIVNYDCCDGYRLQRRRCTKFEMFNLTVTAREAAPEFTGMLEATGILEKLEKDKDSNYTIFATSDNTMDDLRENFEKLNQINLGTTIARRRRDVNIGESQEDTHNTILMNHIVKKTLKTNDLTNNQILESLSSRKLRINVYPNYSGTVRTVNCKAIVKADKVSLNGIVHVVDGVLKPEERDISQILMADPQFSTFLTMLREANLLDFLKSDGVTIFAPTNEAIARRGGYSYGCDGAIAKHHIVQNVLCSAGLTSRDEIKTVTTLSGKDIQLTHPTDSNITIDDHAHITKADIVATNGVIHILDDYLVPDSAKNVSEILLSLNLTTFESLLRSSNLDQETGLTWFVPREQIFQNEKEKIEELSQNADMLRSFVLSHAMPQNVPLKSLKNGQQMVSKDNTELIFNFYSLEPSLANSRRRATVNCRAIRMNEMEACEARIHQISDILYPPKSSIMDIIKDDLTSEFTILKKVIQTADMEKELSEKSDEGWTFLAPTDEAFYDLATRDHNQLLTNATLARQIVLGHIIPEVICCQGVLDRTMFWSNYVQTKAETRIINRKDLFGNIHFGPAEVSRCDQVAHNGVLHSVKRVLMPQNNRLNLFSEGGGFAKAVINPNLQVLLYGL